MLLRLRSKRLRLLLRRYTACLDRRDIGSSVLAQPLKPLTSAGLELGGTSVGIGEQLLPVLIHGALCRRQRRHGLFANLGHLLLRLGAQLLLELSSLILRHQPLRAQLLD